MAGISRYEPIPFVIEYIMKAKPSRILDIGAGFGLLGYLTKAYVDNWLHYRHVTYIDYIDIQKIDVAHLQNIYDVFYFDDILTCGLDLNAYNLIYCFDVIQHLSKEKGNELLIKLKNCKAGKLISVPLGKGWLRSCKNKYEDHISAWETHEVCDMGFSLLYGYSIPDGRELGIFSD